jgi:hypothetical protein
MEESEMKKVLSILLVLILIISCFAVSYGGEAVTEKPDIKIIIDGVRGTYSNTPIIVSGRTLLPLRELLVNLGVPNDDQHIIWNGKEKSVTVIKDATQLYLKVGSTSAKVNGGDATLDAAPVNYKGSVYIPARFVGEAFGKVVVWDGIANRVYMKDKAEFDEIKSLLESSVAKMDGLKRYQETKKAVWYNTTDSGEELDLSFTMTGFTDIENKTVNWLMDYGTFNLYYCIKGQKLYMKDTVDNEWSVEDMTEQDNSEYFVNFINLSDVVYAALSLEDDNKDGTAVLKGNISLDYYNNTDKTIKVFYDESSTEITIDKVSGYITKIHKLDKIYNTPADEEASTDEFDIEYTTSNYNGNFSTKMPDELNSL